MFHQVVDAVDERRRRHVPVPWTSWTRLRAYKELQQRVRLVWPYTMVPGWRLANLFRLCSEQDESVPGDVVECGTCNGGSAALLASAVAQSGALRTLYAFDSFQGLPKPGNQDGPNAEGYEGRCLGQIARVREAFRVVGVGEDHLRIVPGWFKNTFPTMDISTIALLHIDADFYEPVKYCLDTFYDGVVSGGYVVLDDYRIWEGCRKATDEFLLARNLKDAQVQLQRTGHYFQKDSRVRSYVWGVLRKRLGKCDPAARTRGHR